MDSITQVLLGSAVAGAIAPKKYRKRAIVTGAALGTLPDLDVIVHYATDVLDFTRHRSFSHSLLVLPFVGFLLSQFLRRYYLLMSKARLYAMTSLSLITHPLLDAFTSYGTQLFWPLNITPAFTASIFIVDPMYSLWLLFGLLAYWITPKLKWLNNTMLVVSSAYLGLGLIMQQIATNQLVEAFPETQPSEWFVGALTASPFCWHGIHIDKQSYTETAFNLKRPENMVVERYDILPMEKAYGDLTRLRWFNPKTVARSDGEKIVSSDLRMGEFGYYIFEFIVFPESQNGQKHSNKIWPPSAQNELARTYRTIDHTVENYPKWKWSQFVRCLHGEI